jgi:hypothetical protein
MHADCRSGCFVDGAGRREKEVVEVLLGPSRLAFTGHYPSTKELIPNSHEGLGLCSRVVALIHLT